MGKKSELDGLRRGPSSEQAVSADSATAPIPRPAARWKSRLLLPGMMMLSVLGLLGYSAGDMLRPATPVRVIPVVLRSSGQGVTGGGVVAQAPGWVEPWPFAVSVPALADGVIKEVLVLQGQQVKAGQVVARLIDADARIALARTEAQLARQQAEVAAAEVAAGQASPESARVLSLSLELALSPEATALAEARLELERLPSQMAAERARLKGLRTELAAKTRAAQRGVISAVPVNLLKARTEAKQAEVEALHIQEKILSARVKRLEVQAAAELAKAVAALRAAKAVRDEAQLRLERMEVRAATAGVVLALNAEPGTAVTGGASATPVVRLYDPKRLQVRVDVPLATAARVGLEQEAEIVVDVLPDKVYRGKVLRVVHQADIQRNTLQFKVAIHDPSPLLKPEMLARVRFLSPLKLLKGTPGDQRIFAPATVVGLEPGRTLTVWVADLSRNVALRRTVTLGTVRLKGWMEVRSGLNAGDRIIVSPADGLNDGQRIRLKGASSDGPD